MKPFIKCAGGKRKLVPTLLEYVPKKMSRYFEPFVGGGALFWAIKQDPKYFATPCILSDTNAELMATYTAVKNDVDGLIKKLKVMQNEEEVFKKIRAKPKDIAKHGETAVAARFIYLNRTCYNGLMRYNSSGGFNTPFGHYNNPAICDEDNLRTCHSLMSKTELYTASFDSITFEMCEEGDFVYFDPPYMPTSKTSDFTAYTKDGFGPADHEKLRDLMRLLKKRKVNCLLSNSDCDEVRHLYRMGFKIVEVEAQRSISADGEKRKVVTELLIM